jgi:hypothetical protein
MRDFMISVYLPWVPLVESPKTKSRKNFQQPKRFSLPTWWFFWRKITAVLLRCVDYSIWRYNRGFSYQFFVICEKNQNVFYLMQVGWKIMWCGFDRSVYFACSLHAHLCEMVYVSGQAGPFGKVRREKLPRGRPTASSIRLTRPPSHVRYNNYRNYHPHHCSSSVPSISNTVHDLLKKLQVFYFNPYTS